MKKPFLKIPFLLVLCILFYYKGKTQDLTSGLVSVWELDETSGNTAFDAHGNHHGTINGAEINQSGKLDKSYQFVQDNNDNIVVPDHDSLSRINQPNRCPQQ